MAHSKQRAVLEPAHRRTYLTPPGTARLQCLVVCADPARRRSLADAAAMAGWIAYESGDLLDAIDVQLRLMLHLAIVDFTGAAPEQGVGLRQLATGLSRQRELLLVVCGSQGRDEEEIWARQLGAWIYLPGLVEPSELSPLLGEAHDLAERLASTRGSPLAGSSAWCS